MIEDEKESVSSGSEEEEDEEIGASSSRYRLSLEDNKRIKKKRGTNILS